MKKIKRIACLALASVMVLLSATSAYASSTNFILDTEGQMIQIPETYEVVGSIKNLGDAGSLTNAEDLYYSNGYLYVADTANNRVLKMTTEGEVVMQIDAFTIAGQEFSLTSPKGVWVSDDTGEIRVADTGNLRIVVFDAEGTAKAIYGKPDSEALDEEDFTFDVEKICVNSMGYMFALKGANMMKLNSHNEFLGYIGTVDVAFSLSRMLIRTFGTRDQIARTEKLEPTAYNNFTIGRDGVMYGVLADGTSGQIRRLNSVGDNTYPELGYGFTIIDEETYLPTTPAFNDIAVDEDGIVTVIDQNTGLIYQYDAEGNLLTTFGGIGSRQGTFKSPCSIVIDENGYLYVLDYSANSIQIFKPTNFIELVHRAITLQTEGYYEEAKEYWNQVLDIDANYSLAHKCIGKILYKEGNYKESQDHYKMADDKEGYSNSFGEARHEFMRDFFFIIIIVIFIVVFAIGKVFVMIKQNSNKWSFNIEMRGDMDR